MILDIGNTRKKVAVVEDGKVQEVCVLGEEARRIVASMCKRYSIGRAIASVVGREPQWEELLPSDVYGNLHILSYESKLPITIDYETPQTLGMDRVAAVVGARVLHPDGPLVVVDAGSCITIDLLDAGDCYRGGAILPGIGMRFMAMHDYTAALPLVELSAGELDGSVATPMTGCSTRASMVAGVCNASLYEIEGFMRDYERNYPGVKFFLTGGNAVFFAKRLFFPNFANSDLMYIGLDKILEINTKG
ncbi:MAG: type III pantothenate kinase [Bacteroidales bacterium]|nr:type III pantothenate kinase [Bacteroidales bacterium]